MGPSPLAAAVALVQVVLVTTFTASPDTPESPGSAPAGALRASGEAPGDLAEPVEATPRGEAQPDARAPTTYKVRARTVGHGRAEADVARETIAFDSSWAAPPSGLPGPAELLASAFAACLLKNLERAGHLLHFRYESAEVDVVARRQDSPPKFVEISYELRMDTDENQRRVDLVHLNLRKFGTVFNTLAAACDVHGRVRVISPALEQQTTGTSPTR